MHKVCGIVRLVKGLAYSVLLCLTIASCTLLGSPPVAPPIEFDEAYLNQQIRLVVIKELSAFKTGGDVAVLLEYDTSNEIVFPSNYNLRMFSQEDKQWIEIKEKPTTRPTDQVVLSPSIPSSYGHIVGFWPQLDDLSKTYYLRVYVFGEMKVLDGTQPVASYADLILSP